MSPIARHLPVGINPPHEPYPHQGAGEPEDRAEEAKRLTRFPAIAFAPVHDAAPVEHAAAGMRAEIVDQQAEDREPGRREDEIDGPVHEAAGEGEQPEEREEDGKAGGDFGVDEAGLGPRGRVGRVPAMEVGADYPGNDLKRASKPKSKIEVAETLS